MWGERELDKWLFDFREYFRVRGYRLTLDARLVLKEYLEAPKRKRIIESDLSRRKKNMEDVTKGLNKLAEESIRLAHKQNKTTVDRDDVRNAHSRLFCSVWPFCDKE